MMRQADSLIQLHDWILDRCDADQLTSKTAFRAFIARVLRLGVVSMPIANLRNYSSPSLLLSFYRLAPSPVIGRRG